MTSTDAHQTPDSLLSATPAQVEQGINRELLKYPEGLSEARVIEVAMIVVGPVLEARAAEAERARAGERERCAHLLLSRSASLRTTAGGLMERGEVKLAEQQMAKAQVWHEAADLIDPSQVPVPVGETGEARDAAT